MDRHVTRRILHGLGANAYGQLVVIVIQLAGVPILLHAWGTQLYGEWLILAAIPTYLSMADLGFSQSAGNDMTARMARGDAAGTLAVFQSLSVLVYGVAIAGLLLSALALWLLPLQNWFQFGQLSTVEVRWIFWLLAAEVFMKLADGVNHAGFRANGDYALHVSIGSTTTLLQMALVWSLALVGHGPLAAAVALVAVRAVQTPLMAMLLQYRHRNLHFSLAHFRLGGLRPLLKPALANLAMPVATALNMQGMVLVIGAALGPPAVVTFTVLRTLTGLVRQSCANISYAFEPEFAAIHGMLDRRRLSHMFGRMLVLQSVVVSIGVVVLLVGGDWIVKVWTHGMVQVDKALLYWLLLSAVSSMLWHSGITLLKAANAHVKAALWYAFSAVITVAIASLALRLTEQLDLAGLAYVIGDLLISVYIIYALHTMLCRHGNSQAPMRAQV
ncbi:MAG: hypothetical protein M0P72_10035 [Metallibacterium scheffleri]|jgi:O-antigen/teichoic acid export membrane protein|uniref:lipopolysaccharide biosynthesis protein n=1 Tax=Metallibacterium scheffleri TaxID=993689 RepID=UPI0026F1F570|nr:hypothetical protein [Metallibacterium scheffleri]MCK9367471.1 hypothetical protein [Metallibacterium scheffleri]